MKKFIMLLVFLCALVARIVQAGQSHNSGDALTNKDILLMLKAGLTPDNCLPDCYRFRDDRGRRWPVRIEDCSIVVSWKR